MSDENAVRTGAAPGGLGLSRPAAQAPDGLRVEGAPDPLRVDAAPDALRAEVELLRAETDLLGEQADPLRAATLLAVAVGYAPETTGAAPHVTAMARDLATLAERVLVLTGVPPRPGDLLRRLRPAARRTFEHDRGVHLVRHRHHPPLLAGTSMASAVAERAFLRSVLATPVRNPPDLVVGFLPTAAAGIAAARQAQRFGVPLILVVQELTPVGSPSLPAGSAMARARLEALRQASRVVVVSSRLRATVVAQGIAQDRVELLADWSPGRRDELTPAVARSRLGLAPDGFVAVHVGNVGPGQDVATLVAAARELARATVPVRVLVVGEGSHRPALERASADLPLVQFADPVTAGRYPALLGAADVLVALEPPGVPDRTLPSRIRSFVRAGRPVVAALNPGGPADRALRAVPGVALIVAPGDPVALAAALARLRDDVDERLGMAAVARKYAEAAAGRDAPGEAGGGGPVAEDAPRATERLRAVVRAVLAGGTAP